MGEKEQGAAREAGAGMASGLAAGAEGKSMPPVEKTMGIDDWQASSRVAGRSIPENSIAAADLDGDGMPDAAQKVISKSRSNVRNNREAGPSGPGGAESVQYNQSDLEFLKAGGSGGAGPAEAGAIRLDSTPARVADGSGNDIAIGDPGVNGN